MAGPIITEKPPVRPQVRPAAEKAESSKELAARRAAEIRAKATTPDGGLVGEIVIAGKAEMAVQQIPELKAVAGIDIVGPFPAEVQVYTDMAAATFTSAPHAAAAQALLEFLASPAARRIYADKGMEAV